MSQLCQWLHQQLEPLPPFKYPFSKQQLPTDGIYFFYEDGESWGHGGQKPRIVRIGTHKQGNFQGRMSDHYLLNETSKMNFDINKPAPHERSIFRKNIGRALLNQSHDPYLAVWELDFTSSESRSKNKHLRDIPKEVALEQEITRILRQQFFFRFIILEENAKLIGSEGLESLLIGTVAHCALCRPSPGWLGRYSPVEKIRQRGLWLYQHLDSPPISTSDQPAISQAVTRTQQWIAAHK